MQSLNLKQLHESAERYRKYVAEGYRSDDGSLLQPAVMPPPQPKQRKRLLDQLTGQWAKAVVYDAETRGPKRDPRETLKNLAAERIVGNDDLTPLVYLELAVAIARGVCRIKIDSEAASGVLVGPRLLMTNHHVIGDQASAQRARAQFDYQENRFGDVLPVQTFPTAPELFFFSDQDLDFTIVGLQQRSHRDARIDQFPWAKLIGMPGKSDEGDPLNIIQHPLGGLKQIAIRNNTITKIPDSEPHFLYYTTDTDRGSSGSPCFNSQWEMVALHHAAVPRIVDDQIMRKDDQPWREDQDDPALIDWIANEGIRVSAIVAALQSADLKPHERELRDQLFEAEAPNPIELARRGRPSQKHVSVSNVSEPIKKTNNNVAPVVFAPNGTGAVSLQIPLTITVSLGAPQRSPAAAASTAMTGKTPPSQARPVGGAAARGRVITLADLQEAVTIDPDFHNRTGYDEDFLGIGVPLPKLTQSMKRRSVRVPQEFQRAGDPFVLDYHHYSVAMNSDRCFAWYSAANIDGDRRFTMPERDDKWHIDPRIDDPDDVKFQCGEELYATAKTDRGHLTRYLDVAWGDTKDEAIRASNDTFHFTNCCLQLQGFNRSQNRWQGIERFLLEKKAKQEKRRISVFTGPLFDDDDPFYTNQHMEYEIPVPLAFWKVCAIVRPDGSLSATAFVLRQEDVQNLPGIQEALTITDQVQITVQDLEQRTGLRFDVARDNDHLAEGGDLSTLEVVRTATGAVVEKPIRTLDDIVT